MTNAYYNADGDPVARTRGRSSVIREEFEALEDAFDGVEAALATKVDKVNPTTTGTMTHTAGSVDFDAATQVLVPTVTPESDSTNNAASTAFVQAAIGAVPGAMPPNTGLNGRVMATDGTINYWQAGGVAAIAYALLAQGVI